MGLDILLLQDDRGGNIESVRASQRLRFASVELVDEVLALHKASVAGESDFPFRQHTSGVHDWKLEVRE